MNFPIESADWHYAPSAKRTESDDAEDKHGTCVASKVAGARFGVAKDAHIVMLKATPNIGDVLWAFLTARDDIRMHHRHAKSVVLWAFGAKTAYFPGQDFQQPWVLLKRFMQELIDSDVIIVVPAGNEAERSGHVDILPARWESDRFPILISGSVDIDGDSSWFSQGPDHVNVYAPGDPVQCAVGDEYQSKFETGTSLSAAMVSSLKDGEGPVLKADMFPGRRFGCLFPKLQNSTLSYRIWPDSVFSASLYSRYCKLAEESLWTLRRNMEFTGWLIAWRFGPEFLITENRYSISLMRSFSQASTSEEPGHSAQ